MIIKHIGGLREIRLILSHVKGKTASTSSLFRVQIATIMMVYITAIAKTNVN